MKQPITIRIPPLVLKFIGILGAVAVLPGMLAFGWDFFVVAVTGLHPITYFNACAAISLLAFVLVLVVSFVVVIKELV